MSVCTDPAEAIINATVNAMKLAFDPDQDCPPEGGGSTVVHFVSGEGPRWDPIESINNDECGNPFLWVRLVARFRTTVFPAPDLLVTCGGISVVNLEIGVGRCSPESLLPQSDWTLNATEAEIGRDDSWRLDRTVCAVRALLPTQLVGAEPIVPLGPDGGGIVWSTTLYVGIASDQED